MDSQRGNRLGDEQWYDLLVAMMRFIKATIFCNQLKKMQVKVIVWYQWNDAGDFTWKNHSMFLMLLIFQLPCIHAKSLQSCLIPGNPLDCSPPGPSVHDGILLAIKLSQEFRLSQLLIYAWGGRKMRSLGVSEMDW